MPRAGSCRHLLSWAETGTRELGMPPFDCQAAKSDTAGLSGWAGIGMHSEVPQGGVASEGNGAVGAPRSARPAVLRVSNMSSTFPFSCRESSVQLLPFWYPS